MRLFSAFISTLALVNGQTEPCYDPNTGEAQICGPIYHNVAHGRKIEASNTCGADEAEYYYVQMGEASGISSRRHICDQSNPSTSHTADSLTTGESDTWWQSQTMYSGDIEYPNNVTLTLDLHKNHKISSISLEFKSPRPQSMMIEKYYKGQWMPFQYFSSNCYLTFGRTESDSAFDLESEALCTSKHSKITPLTNGVVIFSTLRGRPSSNNYENSQILRDFTTAEKLRFTLVRLNTFGDEIFGDPQVLQSYYYAISKITVGGYCKCNGHADNCMLEVAGRHVCDCEHNTMGDDCEMCKPLYNNKPWHFGTKADAHQCEKCECNGHAESCVYDEELGHGRCENCKDNTAGPKCDECAKNFYRDANGDCVACDCHVDGSQASQCDHNGKCSCRPGVEGQKCDRCKDNFFGLSRTGCEPCNCNLAGSEGNVSKCDPVTGKCDCKVNVDGQRCDTCKVGFMGVTGPSEIEEPLSDNEFGCTPCFCYEHSNLCHSSQDFVKHKIESTFGENDQEWATIGGQGVTYDDLQGRIASDDGFVAPGSYNGKLRFSYNQKLNFDLTLKDELGAVDDARVNVHGLDKQGHLIKASYELSPRPSTTKTPYSVPLHEKYFQQENGKALSSHDFMEMLSEVTNIQIVSGPAYLDNVILESARPREYNDDDVEQANWIENCEDSLVPEYSGRSLDSCAVGYTRDLSNKNKVISTYADCLPCNCNSHSRLPCDTETGVCQCEHDTTGNNCEQCLDGFYGDAQNGTPDDCQPCPCPGGSACHKIDVIGAGGPAGVDDGHPVVCTNCPEGSTGARCDSCQENYFGDPLGLNGPSSDCKLCQCNSNIAKGTKGNCDTLTGECLKCLYNTQGFSCEQCKPNHWGDPTAAESIQGWKGCKECDCDSEGTVDGAECDLETGQCACKPGVTGHRCDECMPEHFGFGRMGCESCDCHPIGSVHGQCHHQTGQCECKPGVIGDKCDECDTDYFGLSEDGCSPCNCNLDGSEFSQCDNEGNCQCRPGVQGQKCDQCQENYFDISAGCKKCDNCYDMVEMVVNQHRGELERLNRVARDIGSSPSALTSDAEFNQQLEELEVESNNLKSKSEDILRDYQAMMKDLTQAGHDSHEVQEKLKEFEEKLKECESQVANAKSRQTATQGTIFALDKEIDQIKMILDDTKDSLIAAEREAEKHGNRHAELSQLAGESNDLLDDIKERSEEVQLQAEAAKETAKRAQQEVDNSLKILNELKNRLQYVQSDDVKTTITRIKEAKDRAQNARQSAKDANDEAIDIYNKIKAMEIPNLSSILNDARADGLLGEDTTLDQKTKQIQDIAGKLETQLQILLNRFNVKRDELSSTVDEAEAEYEKGRKLLETADKLMAMVHAAKMEAEQYDDKIIGLVEKAEAIYTQLSELAQQFGDGSGDVENIEDIDLESQKKKLEETKQVIDHLEGQVDSYKDQSESQLNDVNSLFDRTKSSGENAEDILNQANEFNGQIQTMIKDVEAAIQQGSNAEEQEAIADKREEVMQVEAQSAQRQNNADQANKHVKQASLNLDAIKAQVDELSSRKLADLVSLVNDGADIGELSKDIQAAEQEYQVLQDQFDQLKAAQKASIDQMDALLKKDNADLDKLSQTKQNLSNEVEQLKEISKTLPEWCTSS